MSTKIPSRGMSFSAKWLLLFCLFSLNSFAQEAKGCDHGYQGAQCLTGEEINARYADLDTPVSWIDSVLTGLSQKTTNLADLNSVLKKATTNDSTPNWSNLLSALRNESYWGNENNTALPWVFDGATAIGVGLVAKSRALTKPNQKFTLAAIITGTVIAGLGYYGKVPAHYLYNWATMDGIKALHSQTDLLNRVNHSVRMISVAGLWLEAAATDSSSKPVLKPVKKEDIYSRGQFDLEKEGGLQPTAELASVAIKPNSCIEVEAMVQGDVMIFRACREDHSKGEFRLLSYEGQKQNTTVHIQISMNGFSVMPLVQFLQKADVQQVRVASLES